MVQDPIFWTNVTQRHNHSFCGSENWLSFRRKLLNMSVRVNVDYIKLGRNTSDSELGSYVGQKDIQAVDAMTRSLRLSAPTLYTPWWNVTIKISGKISSSFLK